MGLLTIADLAERWSVSTPEAWELVRLGGVPFVSLRGEVDLTRRGRKPVRFDLGAVVAWEQSRARVWSDDDARRRAASRREPTVRIVGASIGGRLKSGVGRKTAIVKANA